MIEMEEVRIKLSALWVALMLTYLLGDVLRIFSGDFEAAKTGGMMKISPGFYLGMAVLFVLPIVMGFLSLTLPYPVNRWANIILGIVFIVLSPIGVIGIPTAYLPSIIIIAIVEVVALALIIWYAWKSKPKV